MSDKKKKKENSIDEQLLDDISLEVSGEEFDELLFEEVPDNFERNPEASSRVVESKIRPEASFANDMTGSGVFDIDLHADSNTFNISQDDIDDIMDKTDVYRDVSTYTASFQHRKKRKFDLNITSKITVLAAASIISTLILCLIVFYLSIKDLENSREIMSLVNQNLSLGLVFIFIIAFAISYYIASSIVSPIKKIRYAVERVISGNFSQPVTVFSNDEIGNLIEYMNLMMTELGQKRIDREKRLLEQVIEGKRKDKLNRDLRVMIDRQIKETNSTYEFLFAAINSIEQGLFIFDKNGRCADLYTASCLDLFGVEPKDRSLFDVLNIHTEKELETYRTWLATLFSDKFDIEMIIPLGPVCFTQGEMGEDNFKYIELQYFPMRDEDTDEILNVVAIGTDKTTSMINEQELREQKRNAQMVLSILKNRALFQHFSIESNRILNEITGQFYRNVFNFNQIKIGIHSIKGMSASFYANDIRDTCHLIESKLPWVMENISDPSAKSVLIDGLNQIRNNVVGFITKISHMTGHNFIESVINRDIKLESLEHFSEKLKLIDHDIFQDFVDEFIKVPVESFFNNIDGSVNKASKKLGKKLFPVQFSTLDFKICPRSYVPFFQNLIHLFNNIVDHAIESPTLRRELEKPENGKIIVSGFHHEDEWGIVVEDDGRGIDPQMIRAKLQELGQFEQFDNASDEEVIYAIFNPNFSTSDGVSKLSGRGVGMSALHRVVNDLGGKVEVRSQLGVGSKFTFRFPRIRSKNPLKQVA